MSLSFAAGLNGLHLPPTELLIGGDWSASSDRKRLSTLNPATEEVVAEVAQAGPSDVDRAVSAARQSLTQGTWRDTTGRERGRMLNRLAGIMRERFGELALLESIDAGKPLTATRRMDLPA